MKKISLLVSIFTILFFSVQMTMAQTEFSKKVEELADKLTSSTSGKVIDVDAAENTVYISLGEKDSVFEGSVFEVVRLGEVMMLDNKPYYKERPIGRIQLVKVRKNVSLAKPVTVFEQIQKGDKVYQENAITPARPSNQGWIRNRVIEVSGVDLKSAFRRLENGGFTPGPYSENNLMQLSEAIKRFQKFANLNVSGRLDAATWAKLQTLYDPQESASRKTTYGTLLKPPGEMKVSKIALMEFSHNDFFNDLTKNVYRSLSVYFIQKGFQVVERSQLDKVLEEQNISYSGLIDISTARKLGKLLGSEVALLGDVTDMGNNVIIRARMVDVEKGLAMTAAEVSLKKTPELMEMIEQNPRKPRKGFAIVKLPVKKKAFPAKSDTKDKSGSGVLGGVNNYAFSSYKQGDIIPEIGENNMIVKAPEGLALTSSSGSATTVVLQGFSFSDDLELKVNMDINGPFTHNIILWDDDREIISVQFKGKYRAADEERNITTFGDHSKKLETVPWKDYARANDVKITISDNLARLFINGIFFGLQEVDNVNINKVSLTGIRRDTDFLYSISIGSL